MKYIFILFIFLMGGICVQAQSTYDATFKSIQLGPVVRVNGFKTVIGADSLSNTKVPTTKAVRDWVNAVKASIMAYINTADTIYTDGTLQFSNNSLGISTTRQISIDTLRTKQIIGYGTAPTVSVGAGAGTSPTVSVTGTDLAGEITITTGTTPTAGAAIGGILYNRSYASAPYVIVVPSNSNAGALTGLYIHTRSNLYFHLATSTGLTAATTYRWSYIVIQ